jgi:hypothetical protein
MKAYQITDGDSLVFSVDGGEWETVVFKADDFRDIAAATAEELANVLNRSGTLAAYADETGCLALATTSKGGRASLEIDLARSTAAASLGLFTGQARAVGAGLQAARLVSLAAAPFPLPLGAEMMIIVNRRRRRITFDAGITEGRATAAEVAAVINAKLAGVARATRDDRVMLTSPSVEVDSRLEVQRGRMDQGKVDAAAILGFVGAAAISQPYKAEPARLICSGQRVGLHLVNLTAGPIELHFPTGTAVLPARGSLPLSPTEAAHGPLQRLIERGAVRLTSSTDG